MTDMNAKELFQAGRLNEAIQVLGAELRDRPGDIQHRTFLFELLCFAGDLDRAEKHLAILADAGKDAQLGAMLYFSALHAERLRREHFALDAAVTLPDREFAGLVNGQPFTSIVDGDPRLGARLELFAAGAYLWIPFEHLVSVELQPPKRLRDLLWAPALVRTGPDFKEKELGEVLIPVLCPDSYRHSSDAVKLGRETHWQELESGEQVPVGQKTFLVDGEEFPLLEIRNLEFSTREAATA
jgi:type VI secretion system protein ImpE